ncbi:MAG TPA: GNAT family N-acetyltransferase [Acidimicrobiales bacterium]|nr:GNAT family N-acetyltransferase [Acidimicrobiales bacterium]
MAHEVRHNAERSRYEIHVDGELAGIADYRADGPVLTFPHTVVDGHRRGQGLGAELVRGALDDVRRAGKTVVPSCWYVAQFIDENPDYRDLLAA